MNSEEDCSLTEQKKFIIKTDKKNEMDLFLRIYNNDEFAILIYSKNEISIKKISTKMQFK